MEIQLEPASASSAVNFLTLLLSAIVTWLTGSTVAAFGRYKLWKHGRVSLEYVRREPSLMSSCREFICSRNPLRALISIWMLLIAVSLTTLETVAVLGIESYQCDSLQRTTSREGAARCYKEFNSMASNPFVSEIAKREERYFSAGGNTDLSVQAVPDDLDGLYVFSREKRWSFKEEFVRPIQITLHINSSITGENESLRLDQESWKTIKDILGFSASTSATVVPPQISTGPVALNGSFIILLQENTIQDSKLFYGQSNHVNMVLIRDSISSLKLEFSLVGGMVVESSGAALSNKLSANVLEVNMALGILPTSLNMFSFLRQHDANRIRSSGSYCFEEYEAFRKCSRLKPASLIPLTVLISLAAISAAIRIVLGILSRKTLNWNHSVFTTLELAESTDFFSGDVKCSGVSRGSLKSEIYITQQSVDKYCVKIGYSDDPVVPKVPTRELKFERA